MFETFIFFVIATIQNHQLYLGLFHFFAYFCFKWDSKASPFNVIHFFFFMLSCVCKNVCYGENELKTFKSYLMRNYRKIPFSTEDNNLNDNLE